MERSSLLLCGITFILTFLWLSQWPDPAERNQWSALWYFTDNLFHWYSLCSQTNCFWTLQGISFQAPKSKISTQFSDVNPFGSSVLKFQNLAENSILQIHTLEAKVNNTTNSMIDANKLTCAAIWPDKIAFFTYIIQSNPAPLSTANKNHLLLENLWGLVLASQKNNVPVLYEEKLHLNFCLMNSFSVSSLIVTRFAPSASQSAWASVLVFHLTTSL